MIQLDGLNLTLADLQIDNEDTFKFRLKEEQGALLTSCAESFLNCLRTRHEEATPESTGLFRAHSPFEDVTVETVSHALEQVVDYATRRIRLELGDDDWARGPSCRVQDGAFQYIYYWYYEEDDERCYDGGCGPTYWEAPRLFTFKYIGPENTVWNQEKTAWKESVELYIAGRNRWQDSLRIDNMEQLMNSFKWYHGYHGCLENDDVLVLPYMSGVMTLLNPFGLPGVFRAIS